MRYFGSKSSTVKDVVGLALEGRRFRTAADAFGGLGIIGEALRNRGVRVTTCDVLSMPHAFQHSKVVCSARPRFLKVRRHLGLDSVGDVVGWLESRRNKQSWIVREFAKDRLFFKEENAIRIAGAWDEVRSWNERGLLSESERKHLVASLVNSVDAVANTAGTYYAHLKNLDRRAKRDFRLALLPVSAGRPVGSAILGDALESLQNRSFGLLYLDPPYNSRDYSRYYHLPESLSKLSRPHTDPNSRSGVPIRIRSETQQFRQALKLDYIEQLVSRVRWRRLVVQYCEDGFIPLSGLRSCLSSHGQVREHRLNALGYTSKSRERITKHHVFIVDRPTSAAT